MLPRPRSVRDRDGGARRRVRAGEVYRRENIILDIKHPRISEKKGEGQWLAVFRHSNNRPKTAAHLRSGSQKGSRESDEGGSRPGPRAIGLVGGTSAVGGRGESAEAAAIERKAREQAAPKQRRPSRSWHRARRTRRRGGRAMMPEDQRDERASPSSSAARRRGRHARYKWRSSTYDWHEALRRVLGGRASTARLPEDDTRSGGRGESSHASWVGLQVVATRLVLKPTPSRSGRMRTVVQQRRVRFSIALRNSTIGDQGHEQQSHGAGGRNLRRCLIRAGAHVERGVQAEFTEELDLGPSSPTRSRSGGVEGNMNMRLTSIPGATKSSF